MLAGGMLAFALLFDEVIATIIAAGQQQTLPIWMLEELVRPRQRLVTHVVAIIVVTVTFLSILGEIYLTCDRSERCLLACVGNYSCWLKNWYVSSEMRLPFDMLSGVNPSLFFATISAPFSTSSLTTTFGPSR